MQLANSFDGGADGVIIGAANSGGASGDAFSNSDGSLPLFSNVRSHSGGFSMRIVNASAVQDVKWTGLGLAAGTPFWVRFYLWLDAAPATRAYPFRLRTAAAASSGFLRIMEPAFSGVMSAADATDSGFAAEGTVPVATAQWVRIEARIVPSATVGELQWKLYNTPDSTVPTEASANFTGLNLGSDIDQALFGLPGSGIPNPFTIYFDDVAVSTIDWIGPSAQPPPIPNPAATNSFQ